MGKRKYRKRHSKWFATNISKSVTTYIPGIMTSEVLTVAKMKLKECERTARTLTALVARLEGKISDDNVEDFIAQEITNTTL